MFKLTFFIVIIAGLAALVSSGCGYRLAGGSSYLPPEIKTVAVPTFRNRTFEPTIEAVLVREVKREFLTQGRLEVLENPDSADLVVNGVVTNYGVRPLSYDQASVVIEYRLGVTVEVTLTKKGRAAPIWKDQVMETTADYFVTGDTAATRVARDTAATEAARRLSEAIVGRVLEGY